MLEWETLTCHLLSGLPSSWRVSALLLVTGLSHFLVLSHSWVSAHHDLCSTACHPHPTSPTGLGTIDASSRACSWHCILTRCSNFCAVRTLGDDATARSSAVCHYSAPQKGFSPSIWKTHQRPWSHQGVPSRTCQRSHLWTREQKEQPSLGWHSQWNGTVRAQQWLGSGSGAAMARQWPRCSTCWWPLEDGAALWRAPHRQAGTTGPVCPADPQPAVGSALPSCFPGQC